tara:strand:- start:64 stop:585 length:522 start_codon:yes stop_codon:yes gene_type:complete
MVIWITGLSGSGKSTVNKILQKMLIKKNKKTILLDGDIIRELYGNDLNFTESNRKIQINRIQKLAKFFEKNNRIVLVSALYSNNSLLKKNRQIFKNYFEVYLKATLSVLKKRDIKNLYVPALKGKIKNVVGIDIKWNEPKKPNLMFDQNNKITPNKIANIIFKTIHEKYKSKF